MIIKFQQGGNALPPFASYDPVTVNDQTGEETSTEQTPSTGTSSDLTDKELLKMLEKLEGLPSDMQILTKSLLNFYIDLKYSPFPNTSNISSRYLSALYLMRAANFNRKKYDDAFNTVNENGGMNEVAITPSGQFIGMNKKGEYRLLSLEDLKNNKDYYLLSNSELLQRRAYDILLANNSDVINVVQNGIGMESIDKLIDNTLKNIGETSITKNGYISKEALNILGSINMLKLAISVGATDGSLQDMSINGLYKAKLITKSLVNQLKSALNYLYSTLPKNAKTLLMYKANESNQGIESLMTQLISSKVKESYEFDIDLQDNLNADGSKKTKGTEKDNSININPAVAFQTDKGVEKTLEVNSGSPDSLKLLAYLMPINKTNKEPIGITTLDDVSNKSIMSGIFDFSLVTMGDQQLDMAALKNVVIDGSSIYKVYLPYDLEKAGKGIIAPNLDYLETLQKIRVYIKENNITDPELINEVYAQYNLPPFVTMDGKVNELFYKPFGVMNGTALSDAFESDLDLNPKYFERITDNNIINNYWKIIKGEDTKETFDDEAWYNGIIGDYQTMNKGLVYLPLKSTDPTLGMYSAGETPSVDNLAEIKTKYQQDKRVLSYKPLGQLQL